MFYITVNNTYRIFQYSFIKISIFFVNEIETILHKVCSFLFYIPRWNNNLHSRIQSIQNILSHTHIRIHTYIHTYIYTYIYIYIYIYIYAEQYTQIYTGIYIITLAYERTYTHHTHTHTHPHTHIYMYISDKLIEIIFIESLYFCFKFFFYTCIAINYIRIP